MSIIPDVVMINSSGYLTFDAYIIKSVTPNPNNYLSIMETLQGRAVLLLEGGADIDPALYGEENRYSYPSVSRDAWETKLYTAARVLHIPILGICRGHQLMAALSGGTLYQDIYRDLHVHHSSGPLELSGVFASWYPEGYVANSLHHQAVKDIPANAIVVARDKKTPEVIEALDYPSEKMFSVQFHPEIMGDYVLLDNIITYLRS